MSNEETIDYSCRQMDGQMDTEIVTKRGINIQTNTEATQGEGTDWRTNNRQAGSQYEPMCTDEQSHQQSKANHFYIFHSHHISCKVWGFGTMCNVAIQIAPLSTYYMIKFLIHSQLQYCMKT